MQHRSLTSSPPELNDPVVVDGKKYRIHLIADEVITLHDRFGGAVRPNGPDVHRARLYWDPLAGVWRAEA